MYTKSKKSQTEAAKIQLHMAERYRYFIHSLGLPLVSQLAADGVLTEIRNQVAQQS